MTAPLTRPSKTFDFTSFASSNPTTPPPGNQLDAQFANHKTAIDSIGTALDLVIRDDGALASGSVGVDQLAATLLSQIVTQATASVQTAFNAAVASVGPATAAQASATSSAASAAASATTATNAANSASNTATSALTTIAAAQAQVTALANAVQADADAASNSFNDAEAEAISANLYATLAGAWAEYMPGPLPPSVLATMGITGEHWSARWWANQADLYAQTAEDAANQASDFVDRYLGALPSAPSQDDQGNPLTTGALYYDTTLGQMRVWNGASWINVTTNYVASAYAVSTNIQIDTSFWTFNGSTTAFTVKDMGGVNVPLVSNSGCLVALDGVIQNPNTYSVSGSTITFGTAPPANTTAWMIAGVEMGAILPAAAVASINYVIEGIGAEITTGMKGDLVVPFGCTILEWTLLADQSGSIVLDIWRDSFANYPTTVADVITGSAKPALVSAQKARSSTLTGWNTAISAGDILSFNVNSVATVRRVVVSLKVERTV